MLFAVGVLQLPFWGIYSTLKQSKSITLKEKVIESFSPNENWGPVDPLTKEEYKKFINAQSEKDMFKKNGIWDRICDNIFG